MNAVYARLEPSTDTFIKDEAKKNPRIRLSAKKYHDVVFYRDVDCKDFLARIPWFRKGKPTKRNKYQILNSVKRPLVWLN